MALSEAGICNVALTRISQRELITTLDDASPAARACKVHYELARDASLTDTGWKFANRHALLAQLTNVTRSGWSYAYALPADCLKPLYLFDGVRPGQALLPPQVLPPYAYYGSSAPRVGALEPLPYDIEGSDDGTAQILVCDESAADLAYTARITATIAFPVKFIDALAWRLASDLALALPKDRALSRDCLQMYKTVLAEAEVAQLEAVQDDARPDSILITGRR